jgi:hypothetical protein
MTELRRWLTVAEAAERSATTTDGLIDGKQARKALPVRKVQVWDLINEGLLDPIFVLVDGSPTAYFDPAEVTAAIPDIVAWVKQHARDEAGARREAAEDAEWGRIRGNWYEAVASMGARDALDLLASLTIEERSDAGAQGLYEKTQQLQRHIDKSELLQDEPRPRGVPERAVKRLIGTAIGPVPVWSWWTTINRERSRISRAKHGGPRPGRVWIGETLPKAVGLAGAEARKTYGKASRKTSTRLRFAILARDQFTCRYCGRKAPDVELHVDHITPLSRGGSDEPDNLGAACSECNAGKASLLLS